MKHLFSLPEIRPKSNKVRRDAIFADASFLKGDQPMALEKVEQFLDSPGGGMFLLEGFAGTGKTTLTNLVSERYLAKYRTKKVLMTAPTNKAVGVMYDRCDFRHTNLDFMTCHRSLGLKESKDDYGKQVFKQDYSKPCEVEKQDLYILDEVSMLSDELFHLLVPYVERNNLKILFIGDPAQIPPVGQDFCIPFKAMRKPEMGIKMGYAKLEAIVRQEEGNPIIELTMAIRNSLKNFVTIPDVQTSLTKMVLKVWLLLTGRIKQICLY